MKTPIVSLFSNQLDTTKQVFEAIHQAQPLKLLVINDGSRTHWSGKAEQCADVCDVIQQVDWKCAVLTNYSDISLGCGLRV